MYPENALKFVYIGFRWLSGSRWNTVFLYHHLVILAFLEYFSVQNVNSNNTEWRTEYENETNLKSFLGSATLKVTFQSAALH